MVELTLRQMEYVVALHDTGHFGQAAQACHISQPALSRQVKKVEELLEVPLFERTPEGTVPTPSGREFVTEARQILEDARQLIDRVASVSGELRGALTLGVIPTVGPYFLPGVLQKLNDTFPALELSILEARTSDLLERLRRRQIDLALMASPVASQRTESVAVARDPFVAILPAKHPLAQHQALSASDLIDTPLLLLEEGHCFRDHALDFCTRTDSIAEADVQATSLSTLLSLVELGHGLTIVPSLALPRELAGRSSLTMVPFQSPPPARKLSLFWRQSSPRGEAFHRLGAQMAAHIPSLNRYISQISSNENILLEPLISR